MGEFFGLIFICMGNAIRSKINTSNTVFDQPIPAQTPPKSKGSPFTKVKIENHRIVPFDGLYEAS